MKEEKQYKIGELAELAGVSRRTVRFYVQNALMSPPVGLGRGSYYTDEHLTQIARLRDLQKQGILLRQAVHLNSEQPEPIIETPTREIVTRVRITEGLTLEFSHPVKVPAPSVLIEISTYLKNQLGIIFINPIKEKNRVE
ncbi:MAG: MerR family transcriptional regulator [Candidatus Neomarinimicrobiota bacterium]